jgi:hypothetical protein
MTTATRILIVRSRPADGWGGKPPLALGVVSKGADGWRFIPFNSARKSSRKGHDAWEKAVPRWTGHPHGTESIRMEPGETLGQTLAKLIAR